MRTQKLFCLLSLLCAITLLALPALAQSTVSTGSIQGTVEDPNGAVVPNAAISITNKGNGQTLKLTSSSSGSYASGALQPGAYEARVESKGFRTEVVSLTVQVGTITTSNVRLTLGQASEVVEVTG